MIDKRQFAIIFLIILATIYIPFKNDKVLAATTSKDDPSALRDECGHTLAKSTSFFKRHFDFGFLKKFFKHWIPFTEKSRVKMQFFLYKRDFPECGREIVLDKYETLEFSGFNASHPTRIIIHGWMSQSKGSLNRAVKNAYLSLTKTHHGNNNNNENANNNANNEISVNDTDDVDDDDDDENNSNSTNSRELIDFNVIVVDWSVISSNVNYFGVVDLIEDLGFILAEFVRFLYLRANLNFNTVYLIGHSLGAQIAGSAGKQVQPLRFNTIYALDAAGPKFRDFTDEYRIDPSDADYVESIQTSRSLGFGEPIGHATFYPNYGKDQKNCFMYGCSHSRSYNYFAESITSKEGFWGTLCQRQANDVWILSDSGVEFRMGGEPSTIKYGTFYVKTNDSPPYAMGKRLRIAANASSSSPIENTTVFNRGDELEQTTVSKS